MPSKAENADLSAHHPRRFFPLHHRLEAVHDHRGPIYTVPFGELGAVENMSRDWVIDKMTIGVTYDTDIANGGGMLLDRPVPDAQASS